MLTGRFATVLLIIAVVSSLCLLPGCGDRSEEEARTAAGRFLRAWQTNDAGQMWDMLKTDKPTKNDFMRQMNHIPVTIRTWEIDKIEAQQGQATVWVKAEVPDLAQVTKEAIERAGLGEASAEAAEESTELRKQVVWLLTETKENAPIEGVLHLEREQKEWFITHVEGMLPLPVTLEYLVKNYAQ